MKAKRACMACGRVVAVLSPLQNAGGGKARVKHKCPHGVDCVTGAAPHHGTGYNAAPTMGKNACLECNRLARTILATRKAQNGEKG